MLWRADKQYIPPGGNAMCRRTKNITFDAPVGRDLFGTHSGCIELDNDEMYEFQGTVEEGVHILYLGGWTRANADLERLICVGVCENYLAGK